MRSLLRRWQSTNAQGIGSTLVRQELELRRERDRSIVVVGHPGYYPRFSAELARNLHSAFSGEAWMALELKAGALENVKGTVRYPEAFRVLDY